MIEVLQGPAQIQEADEFLSRHALPKHAYNVEKNWDLFQLYSIARPLPSEIKIIDLGCGGLSALKLLCAMGFKNLYGIDLYMPLKNYFSQFLMMRDKRSFKMPFHLQKGDLTKTGFPDKMFDMAVCVSVIEHGVNLENFFVEVGRLLKPGGTLFITTDYWDQKILISKNKKPFGLDWKIFSKEEVKEMVDVAYKYGFSSDDSTLPCSSNKCVAWNGQEYTFIVMVLTKHISSDSTADDMGGSPSQTKALRRAK